MKYMDSFNYAQSKFELINFDGFPSIIFNKTVLSGEHIWFLSDF